MWFLRPSLTLVVAFTLVGCADPPTSASPAVAAAPSALIAATETGEQYGNVALMVGRKDASSPWGPVCTGTLIAPDVVLTAGHCAFLAPILEGYTEFGVTFAPKFSASAVVINAVAHSHPDFYFPFASPFPSPANPYDIFDLAVLVLETPADGIPAQLPPPGLLDALSGHSGPLTAVGYGIPRADGSLAERGTRRTGTMRLDQVFGPLFSTTPDPTAICLGDSGGPILRGPPEGHRGRRGATMLLGVGQGGDCGTLSTYYRVDTPQARSFLGAFVHLPG